MKSKQLLLIAVAVIAFLAIAGAFLLPINQSAGVKMKTVTRETEPEAMQVASQAIAIAVRQYSYARLLTDDIASLDPAQISRQELDERIERAVEAWRLAEEVTTQAQDITKRSVPLIEEGSVKQTISHQYSPSTVDLPSLPATVHAASPARSATDPHTWAENLTKQYDVLRGAKRYQQLADQLGTDAKTAYQQMQLAQKIIRNQAELDEATAEVDELTRSLNTVKTYKTASKVGLLAVSAVATGGGSVTLLEGAGFVASGIDTAIEVTDTGSTIILGEGNKVAAGFEQLKNKTAPVTALIGLASLDFSKAKDAVDGVVYITDSISDFVNEDRILGLKIEQDKDGKTTIGGQVVELPSPSPETRSAAIKTLGLVVPEAPKSLLDLANKILGGSTDPNVVSAKMSDLAKQLADLEKSLGITSNDSKDFSIGGRYSSVATGSDDEVGTGIATIKVMDNMARYTFVDSEDGEEDMWVVDYDKSTQTIRYEAGSMVFTVKFTKTDGQIKGIGSMTGEIWDQPIEAQIVLTKLGE